MDIEPSDTSVPARIRRHRGFRFDLALLLFWVGGCAIPLYINRSQLLLGFDGGFARDIARRQFEWHVPIFSASMDFFQGLGDNFFPFNFTLFPAFIAASQLGSVIAEPVVVYVGVMAEITVAIFFFSRCLGTSRTVSIAAAILTGLTIFPFSSPSLIWGVLALAPTFGSIIAVALVMGGAFVAFGRTNWAANLALAILIVALFVWSVLASPTFLILSGPFLLVCGVSGIWAAANAAERRRKIGLILVISILVLATGPVLYVAGLVLETAATTFPQELMNDRGSFMFASILFHWRTVSPTGPLLVCFAIAGAAISIRDRRHKTLRVFAITFLAYLGGRLTFAVATILFDFWRGPSPLYFEFFIFPLYSIFTVFFIERVIAIALRVFDWEPPSSWRTELGLVIAGVILAVMLAATKQSADYGFHYPPTSTPFTDLIAQEAAMRPGTQFRGRTANMIGQTIDRNVNWFDLHERDLAHASEIGNEMRVAGLHVFGIASLFEYGPTITPAFYAVTSRLLGSPGDSQLRNVSVLRNINLRILAMLGVRFIITDALIDGTASLLRASLPVKNATLYLYEIKTPNLGDYSPTVIRRLTTATDIIDRLADAQFDSSREVIADLAGENEVFVPASSSRLTFNGISLRVEAESTGRSILLLPIEFSRCLKITLSRSREPLIFRANLLETGIIFSGRLDASLSVRSGPFFLNPGCRLQDYFDMTALQVGKVPLRTQAVTDRSK